jgi:hypothetical protein
MSGKRSGARYAFNNPPISLLDPDTIRDCISSLK